ncbi:MAG: hypothetical protein JWM49_615 [Microbacteriaceae bacterium]|nr:hypothetical protein [Microbacteriaceae bacterium]
MAHLVLDELRSSAPTKPDGSEWRLRLIARAEHQTIYGDTFEDLVRGAFIEGYPSAPYTADVIAEMWRARRAFACNLADVSQANVVLDVENEDPDRLHKLCQREVRALLEARATPKATTWWWSADIPLYIVASSFAPFATRKRPKPSGFGEVVMIDDFDDESLVTSVAPLLGWEIVDVASSDRA